MSEYGKVPVNIIEFPGNQDASEMAEALRDYADLCERGEISEVALVTTMHGKGFTSYANFKDKLALSGALQYIQAKLMQD